MSETSNQTVPVMFGHDLPAIHFRDTFNQEKSHHAWLIKGPAGIGKSLFARLMAAYALTLSPPDKHGSIKQEVGSSLAGNPFRLDGQDENCHLALQLSHPNLRIVQKTEGTKGKLRNFITVEDVKSGLRLFSTKANENEWRIVIVDSADELNLNGANALLKTLEEPPGKSMLILVSHQPHRLLPTITSRCRSLSLKTLNDEDMRAVIFKYFSDSSDQPKPEELATVLEFCQGKPALAVDLLSVQFEFWKAVMHLFERLPHIDHAVVSGLADRLSQAQATSESEWFYRIFLFQFHQLKNSVMASRGDHLAVNARLNLVEEHWADYLRKWDRSQQYNLDKKQLIISSIKDFASLKDQINYLS